MSWPEFLEIAGRFLKGAGWVLLPLLALPFMTLIIKRSAFLSEVSRHLIQLIDTVSYRVGELVKWALPVLVLTVAFSVFTLSIFGLSWTKLFESAEYLHATAIMLGAAATLLAGQHVRVDVFHARMPPKKKALTDLCGFYIFLMPVCLLLLWNSHSFINFAWMSLEGSGEADGIKGEYLLKTTIPIFCVMMLAQGLSIALRAAKLLTAQPEPETPPNTPPLFPEAEIHT